MRIVPLLLSLGLLTLVARSQPQSSFLKETEKVIADLSERLKPTVVHIEVWSKKSGIRAKSLGSGVVIRADGTIVTNHHVVEKAEQIQVILDDKSRHDAKVLRSDRLTDLAVLQIQVGRPLAFASFANSDRVQVGQWVLAIGNPYGLDRTVSFGILSGKGRYMPGREGLTPLNDFLQTDAMIDPGSSGGPLVDLEGKVVGINSSGIGRGIGFTIPAKVVQEVLEGKQQQGQLERGWLGIYTQAFPRPLARHRGQAEVRGLLVSDFAADSPALAAGLRAGDVITAIDGQSVEAEQEDEIARFAQQISRLTPGQKVPLGLRRGQESLELTVSVGLQPSLEGGQVETPYGFQVTQLTPYLQQNYRLLEKEGLVVSDVEEGSLAEEAGIEEGDLLLEWEDQPIGLVTDLEKLLTRPRPANLLLRLKKGQYRYYALISARPKANKP